MAICIILITIWLMLFFWHYTFRYTYVSLLKKIFRYTQDLIDEQKQAWYSNIDGRLNKDDSSYDCSQPTKACGSYSGSLNERLPLSFLLEGQLDPNDHEFDISDGYLFLHHGISAVIEDQVIDRFKSRELGTWNLMTRKSRNYHFMSKKITIVWLLGLFWRYIILLPMRIIILIYAIFNFMILVVLVGFLPKIIKDRISEYTTQFAFKSMIATCTALLKFHDKHFRPTSCGICVANHTTIYDAVALSCDNSYTFVGQLHSGFLGFSMIQLSKVVPSIWFDRSDYKDRHKVINRLREVISSSMSKYPVLVFPEGSCVNNTAVFMFKKGSFEVSEKVYPIAIKYDSTFAEPYWDRKAMGYVTYVLAILTSWAMVCDVYYLPPMERLEGEKHEEFAERVKTKIAHKVRLKNLEWDADLKWSAVNVKWTKVQQSQFAKIIT